MQLNNQVISTPPRAAATVVLLRQAPHLEVFMLQRHANSAVLGGAYVFAGGKVDASDAALDPALVDQLPAALHQALGEPTLAPAQALALHVAALREAFEECGVLLAGHATAPGAAASADAAGSAGKAAGMLRHAIGQGLGFGQALQHLGLRLHTRRLQPWTRWITSHMPSVSNKRFDTRFFLAELDPSHPATHDNVEATASLWMAPRQALEAYWAGQLQLAPPQIMSLVHLARHDSVASVMREAASRPPPAIMSAPHTIDGERMMAYPGDALHPQRQRLIPGPLRLYFRQQRFEPEGGLPALLAD